MSEKTVEEQLAEATAELALKNAELERVQSAAETEASARHLAEGLLQKAKEDADAKGREVRERAEEITRPFLDKLRVDLGGISVTPKIVFPEASRYGNLSKGDRELLDIVTGRKTVQMDTGSSGAGSQWVPLGYSADIYKAVELRNVLRQYFPVVNQPTDVYYLPGLTANPTVYKGTPGTAPTISNPTTAQATLTSEELCAYVSWSYKLDEASVVPMLDLLKDSLGKAIADAEESAILWGDLTTGATSIDKNTSATSAQAVFDGIWHVVSKGTATWFTGYATDWGTSLNVLLSAMGAYALGQDCLLIVSPAGYYHIATLTNFLTVDKIGNDAFLRSGLLPGTNSRAFVGTYAGIPVAVSPYMYDTDATGTRLTTAGSNTKHTMIVANRAACIIGDRRQLMIEVDRDITERKNMIVASERVAFTVTLGGTTGCVGGIYNG